MCVHTVHACINWRFKSITLSHRGQKQKRFTEGAEKQADVLLCTFCTLD